MSETGMQSCYVDYKTRAIADLVDYYGLGMLITRINVPVKERGKGAGGKLLAAIIADADRTHTTLFLEIVPTGEMTEEQLVAWYGRHGFKYWKGVMRRRPRWRSMAENPIYPKKRGGPMGEMDPLTKALLTIGEYYDDSPDEHLESASLLAHGILADEEISTEQFYKRLRLILDNLKRFYPGHLPDLVQRAYREVWKEYIKMYPRMEVPPRVRFGGTVNPVFGKKRHKFPVGSDVVVRGGGEDQIGDVRGVIEHADGEFIYEVAFSRPTGVFLGRHWEYELDRVWHRPRFHVGDTITAWLGGPYKGRVESVWFDKNQKWWTYNVSVVLPPPLGMKDKSVLTSEPEHILIGWEERTKRGP